MVGLALLAASLAASGVALGQCPFADGEELEARSVRSSSRDHMRQYDVDDRNSFLTSDVGGPIADRESLKVGERGPTLLEDFIFRQKITRFDHERVPERAVHARGAGAYGTFTSHDDFSSITAANFLSEKGKRTPMFVRFSTVAGSRGSADTARDVHGFATRFFTDEGNFDIVGNNIPVFFIQDAIQFPDLIHAVKPKQDREIPQGATAHDSAWDFFTEETSCLHTLFWAMAGNGIPRSYRHMDGFGVHTFRLVNAKGESKFVKWHWKTLQGKASLVWDEAQSTAGRNADFHRQDLWDAIESGHPPEWELKAQIFDESDALKFGFDVLDPTKIVPEELVPLRLIGTMRLDENPKNYFAETEQIMFQPGHIVRGIDFSDDPLLQGRIFSYLDTQLNRHGGPNFEQLPINRPLPRVGVHNNNRDGAAQNMIPLNTAAYSPNTLNNGNPKQANQTVGKGFFTAPHRHYEGHLIRKRSDTFSDHWSQPRLFYNSLNTVEKQFLINAIRFEVSQVNAEVQKKVIHQLNKIDHDIAERVARAICHEAPPPDNKYYHSNRTVGITIFGEKLPKIDTLRVGLLATTTSEKSLEQARQFKNRFAAKKVVVTTIGEVLSPGVDVMYSTASAVNFDGVIVLEGAGKLVAESHPSTSLALYPPGRPAQIVRDAYRWGKPVGFMGEMINARKAANVEKGNGVHEIRNVDHMVGKFEEDLKTFKFTDRFPIDRL